MSEPPETEDRMHRSGKNNLKFVKNIDILQVNILFIKLDFHLTESKHIVDA